MGTSGINKHLAVPMKSKLFSLVGIPGVKKEIEILATLFSAHKDLSPWLYNTVTEEEEKFHD